MKKFAATVLFVLLLATAADAQELIYMHDGSIIKGLVIEQQADEIIKVQTRDGDVFVYPMSLVECIIKDNGSDSDGQISSKEPKLRMRHKGVDFNMDIGYNVATAKMDGDKLFVQFGVGKRFTQHFYWGAGVGVMMPMGDFSCPIIPLSSDFRLYLPIRNTSVVPGAVIRLGYAFNTAGDTVIKYTSGEDASKKIMTIEAPDFVVLQFLPTVTITRMGRSEFVGGVGYTHFIGTVGLKGHGMVTVSAGFNFGKPVTYYRR